MSLAGSVNWPEVAKVLETVMAVLRYLFGVAFVGVAIKFFWQVAKSVNDFVHKQDDLARMATGIADNAKIFADRVTKILERHDDWLNDHNMQLAVINDRLGIAPEEHPHRRHMQRRKSDRDIPPDDRTPDDAPGAD